MNTARWLVPMLLITLTGCATHPLEVRDIRSLTIYGVSHRASPELTQQALATLPAYRPDDSLVAQVMQHAQYVERTPVWKGSRLAVATTHRGDDTRLAISYYGGFFALVGKPGLYQVAERDRAAWEQMVDRALAATRARGVEQPDLEQAYP